jgi:uncharacterized membrane protein YdjX (TVP38/TMEM64 family)
MSLSDKPTESTDTTDVPSSSSNFITNLWNRFIRTWKGHSKTTWLWIILFLAIMVFSVLLLLKMVLDETWLFSLVITYFVLPMLEIGGWGFLVFILFMGVQGIIAPIPSELALLTTGIIWGATLGSVVGVVGSMFAAITAYEIARKGGRPLAEKFVGDDLQIIDKYLDKYGTWAIFFGRAFPFMNFDPLSYASGFLGIERKGYLLATLFGSIIRSIIYAIMGATMIDGGIEQIIEDPASLESFIQEGASKFNTMFWIILLVLGLAFLGYQFILMPKLRKAAQETDGSET